MKFKTLDGKERTLKNAKKYIIDWEAKSRSKSQFSVKQFLKKYWHGDVVFEEFKVVGTRLSLDFFNANKKIAIEVQGHQHVKFVPFFHQDRGNYLKQFKRDVKKYDFCEINNIQLIEIYPEDKINENFFTEKGVYL